jgi:hypothetical protein
MELLLGNSDEIDPLPIYLCRHNSTVIRHLIAASLHKSEQDITSTRCTLFIYIEIVMGHLIASQHRGEQNITKPTD